MEKTNEHICTYTEAYRTLNSVEPSLTNLGMECKECGSFLYCTAGTEEIKEIPEGAYTFKGRSKAEEEESLRKSNAIRNKVRAKMGLAPLGEDGFPTDTTLESRAKAFEELKKFMRGE